MLLNDAVRDYLLHIKHERGLTASTHRTYQSALHAYERWLVAQGEVKADLSSLSLDRIRQYMYARSAGGLRPRTLRGDLTPIKSLIEFLIAAGAYQERNPFQSLQMPKKDAPIRHTVSDEECALLLAACDRLPSLRRCRLAKAVLSVMIFAGLRAGEALAIQLSDVSLDAKTLMVVNGKGKKSRTLYPPEELFTIIKDWLAVRNPSRFRGKRMAEPVCVNIPYLWAYDPHRRLSYNGLLSILRDVKRIAGMEDREHIHAHALRRGMATRLMNAGASIRTIQAALGHAEANTTFAYLDMSGEPAKAMRDLASLSVPRQGDAAGTTRINQFAEALLENREAPLLVPTALPGPINAAPEHVIPPPKTRTDQILRRRRLPAGR